MSKNVRKSIKKVEIIGIMACMALGTVYFEASASNKESDMMIEKSQIYDELQNIFLSVDKDIKEDDILNLIEEYGLEYTVEEYNGTPKERNYSIAFEADVALQKYAEAGDCIEVSFDKNDGTILYAEYASEESSKNAVYYNYGTYWDFREDVPDNAYTGYYYHEPGDTKGGITIKYSNGNSKETGYYSVDSAEKALSHM